MLGVHSAPLLKPSVVESKLASAPVLGLSVISSILKEVILAVPVASVPPGTLVCTVKITFSRTGHTSEPSALEAGVSAEVELLIVNVFV